MAAMLRDDLVIEWVIRNDLGAVAVVAHPSVIDKITEWKRGDPRFTRRSKLSAIERGAHMQRQFTLELRVDYADPGKNEVMQDAVKAAAAHLFATAQLLADNGVKPQIAAHSDDWYCGHEEIKWMEDIIAKGLHENENMSDGGISSDLLAAARDG